MNDNVVPLRLPIQRVPRIVPSADQEISIDFPPGSQIEIGGDCLFIFLKNKTHRPMCLTWERWLTRLEAMMIIHGTKYEILTDSQDFRDGVRIHTRSKYE